MNIIFGQVFARHRIAPICFGYFALNFIDMLKAIGSFIIVKIFKFCFIAEKRSQVWRNKCPKTLERYEHCNLSPSTVTKTWQYYILNTTLKISQYIENKEARLSTDFEELA